MAAYLGMSPLIRKDRSINSAMRKSRWQMLQRSRSRVYRRCRAPSDATEPLNLPGTFWRWSDGVGALPIRHGMREDLVFYPSGIETTGSALRPLRMVVVSHARGSSVGGAPCVGTPVGPPALT